MAVKVELLTIDNGDVAVYVNGDMVVALEAGDAGPDLSAMAERLAESLKTRVVALSASVPDDDEWAFNDAYAQAKASTPRKRSR